MLPFDELNRLVKPDDSRNIDIDRYFDEMDLSDEEKENRKEFTRQLRDDLFEALALLFIFLEYNTLTGIETVKRIIENALLTQINRFSQADSDLTIFCSTFAENFVETAVRNAERYQLFDDDKKKSKSDLRKAAYYFSEVRAKISAADTANGVFNHDLYREAIRKGKTYKEWVTIMDGKERRTHADVNGTIIPIDELFHVGAAVMRYCHDFEMASEHPEELVNCRCQTIYFTTEEFQNVSRDS